MEALRMPLVLGCSLLLLAGCQKEEIKTYRVAKDAKAPAAAQTQEMPAGHPPVGSNQSPAMPAMMPPASMPPAEGGSSLVWTAPQQWQTKPLGQMRKGSFSVPLEGGAEGDLSIFVFPGTAGGLIENINRWRGQIGLDPITPDKLPDETQSLKSESGLDFTLVDMSGKSGDRILGAILVQGDMSWFFKLKGPDAPVSKIKADFLAFLKTVKQP